MRAQVKLLPDGRRLHLQDGPIDIVLEAFGAEDQIQAAYQAAAERFVAVLDELCGELPRLRAQAHSGQTAPRGVVARRMFAAVLPYSDETFITPMAAVAGAVAEEILFAMTAAADLRRAYVNDGGDIAVHVGEGEKFVVGMADGLGPSLFGTVVLGSDRLARTFRQPWLQRSNSYAAQHQDYFVAEARGIATSGWRGRSFSLGIADAVTVLAKTAAMADAAATIIANAVDLPGHPRVSRKPASELSPDSDLGDRLVTCAVGELTSAEVSAALDRGAACAEALISRRLIATGALCLQGISRVVPSGEPTRNQFPVSLSPRPRSTAHA